MTDELTIAEREKYLRTWQDEGYRVRSPGLRHLAAALKWMAPTHGATITDWGSGSGQASDAMVDQGFDVRMIDIAANAYRGKNGPVIESCLWELPDDMGATDYGFCADVLEHIPPERVDLVLDGIAKRTRTACYFQIALFRHDTFAGPLHLSVFPVEWWRSRILQHFGSAEFRVIGSKHVLAVARTSAVATLPERKKATMEKDFRALALAHKGKTICVMGGAPSLADDLSKVKANIYISTNGHGADIVTPNYLLAMDETNKRTNGPMGEDLRAAVPGVPIISPHAYADHQLTDWPQAPRFVLSGMVAVWAAFMMGAKCVVVAGMDAYGGESGYIDEARKMARDVPVPVRTLSGPLSEVWPAYDPAEKFGRYSAPAQIEGWLSASADGEITVEVLKQTTVRGALRQKGDELKVARHEVRRLLKHRMLREI